MLEASQIELLQRLLHATADDQSRIVSATWSSARLRIVLVHACLEAGHRVIERAIAGTPAHSNRPEARGADLQALLRHDARALNVDLLVGSSSSPAGDASMLSLATVHRAIERVSSGAVDALLISADAPAYERLFEPVDGRTASRQRREVATVLPRTVAAAFEKPHVRNLGDVTMAAVMRDVRAFGLSRLACAVYVTQ
jgi:hypothetical protein